MTQFVVGGRECPAQLEDCPCSFGYTKPQGTDISVVWFYSFTHDLILSHRTENFVLPFFDVKQK